MPIDPDDTDDLAANVGRRLALVRQALGLAQYEWAEEAGISQPRYNMYETGRRLLTLDAALKLCARSNLTLDWLYRGDPSGLPYALAEKIRKLRRA